MDGFFVFSAKYLFLLPVVILGTYVLLQPWPEKKKAFIFTLPSLALTYLLALAAGHLYYDPRPFVIGHFAPLLPHLPDNGFPSDHTLLVSALAIIGTYLNWKLGFVLWVIALTVAVARVYVGLHHPIDVTGSIFIALVVGIVVYVTLKYAAPKGQDTA